MTTGITELFQVPSVTLPYSTEVLISAAAGFILLGAIMWFMLNRLRNNPPAIAVKPTPLDADHRAFFGLLEIAVRDHLTIMPSMPVADVLEPKGWGQKWLLKKIRSRQVDYILCDRRSLEIKAAVLLESKSPSRSDKKISQLMHSIFDSADLPLLEYRFKPCFDVPTLRREILSAANLHDTLLFENSVQNNLEAQKPDTPDCPKCGKEMQQRRINKGEHAGELCWVCVTYPDCKGARLKAQN